jgi:MFS family permease
VVAHNPVAETRMGGGLLSRVPGIGNDLGLGHNNLMLFWAMLFNELSFGFYQILLPLYIESLGASPGIVGLVIGLQGLLRLVFLLPSGMIADRVPLRTLIVVSRIASTIGIFSYGLAQEWWHLLPVIVIIAAGNIAFPAISKVLADSSDDRSRTRAFTLIYTVGPSTATLLSPSLGGLLADTISLRSIFFAAAIAQAVAVLFFSRLNKTPVSADTHETGGYRAVLAYRPVAILCGLFLMMLLVLTTGFTLVPNYLRDVHGIGFGTIGQFGSLGALGSVLLGLVIARVAFLGRPMNGLFLTVLLCLPAFVLFIVSGSVVGFGLAYFCRGAYLVAWSTMYAALGEMTPERLRSRSFALAELLGGAGFGIAPFIAGALYESSPSLPIVVSLIAIVPLLGLILLARRYVGAPPAVPVKGMST